MTKLEEARAALRDAIRAYERDPLSPVAILEEAIDAFAASVRAEVLTPREASPELAEAEKFLRECATNTDDNDLHLHWVRCVPIAAELDRLRAEVSRLQATPAPADAESVEREKYTRELVAAARDVSTEAICKGAEVDDDLDDAFDRLESALENYDSLPEVKP